MNKYLVANWKTNKTTKEVRVWADRIAMVHTNKLEVIICPSFVHLPLLHSLLPNVTCGAQTISPYPNGAYTGAVSAQIASEYARFAILGHTERRKYFHETNVDVTNAVIQTLENDMTPIIAVDTANWHAQLTQLTDQQLSKSLIMYEPADAISTSENAQAADLNDVKSVMREIHKAFQVKGLLYGGSVSVENILLYMRESDIDGVVVGAASLDAEKFQKMIEMCR